MFALRILGIVALRKSTESIGVVCSRDTKHIFKLPSIVVFSPRGFSGMFERPSPAWFYGGLLSVSSGVPQVLANLLLRLYWRSFETALK